MDKKLSVHLRINSQQTKTPSNDTRNRKQFDMG